MNVTIENRSLIVGIKSKGAELFSVVSKETGLEYVWSGDPAFWGKTSPILFPIVGTLKDDTFLYNKKKYTLSRHGFARDSEFAITQHGNDSVVFVLDSSPASLQKYPFGFRLKIKYYLEKNSLNVEYVVENTGNADMYFSIGGHPAFKVPVVEGALYEDHYLQFDKTENAPRWPISPGGLIESNPVALLQNSDKIHLTKSLFLKDALVLKQLKSDTVSIKSTAHPHGLDFYFGGFPFLGIWAANNADFVCIEPWCGIADAVTHNQELVAKEGIEKVVAGNSWSRTWSVRFF